MIKFKTNIPSDFGKEYLPIKHCYTPVREKGQKGIYRVAKVNWNQGGYQPLGKADPNDPHEMDKFVGSWGHCRQICDNFIKHINVSPEQENQIVWRSMEVQNEIQ